jgi:hypothetical protein
MAFKREIELSVGPAGGTGLIVSGLNIEFDIERSRGTEDNKATFVVYNAKENTRNEILKKGNIVNFKAGHEDEGNAGIIFVGTITRSETIKDGPNWVTTIEAYDYRANDEAFIYGTISVSYKEATQLSTIVNDFANAINIPVNGTNILTSITNNGFVYAGTIGGMANKIRNNLKPLGLGLYFDQSEMFVYNKNDATVFDVVRLTNQSGMIYAKEISDISEDQEDKENEDDKKRVEVRGLLNPKLKPNSAVDVEGVNVKGTFIIEKIRFFGDNDAGDFDYILEASE